MSTLSDLVAQIEGYASTAVSAHNAGTATPLQELVADATLAAEKVEEEIEEAGEAIEKAAVAEFPQVVAQFGQLAANVVTGLFQDAEAGMNGSAKANLAAITIVQAAGQQGVTLLAQDVTALIKMVFVSVEDIFGLNPPPAAA